MRVLNAAQSTLAYLGVLAGHEHTFDAVADPLLAAFVRRMLVEESVPTLTPVPGVVPLAYVEQSLDRLRNTAIRHRYHQIATDGSQKIVQRLLNPAAERLRRGESVQLPRRSPVAGLDGLPRPRLAPVRPAWTVDDPQAGRDRRDRRAHRRRPDGAGRRASSRIDTIFAPDARRRTRLP